MIIDVKKYLIIGTQEDLDLFYQRAQQEGFIEFIQTSSRKSIELPSHLQNLLIAIKILKKLPVRKAYEGVWDVEYANQSAARIINLKSEIERLYEEKRLIEAEIVRVAPFGDFSLEDLDYIQKEGHRKIQFFNMKSDKSHLHPPSDEAIYIGTEYDLDYFITINKETRSYPDMIEMRIDRPLGELQNHLSFVKESIHMMEVELKNFAGHIEYLHEVLIEELNVYHLESAKHNVSFPIQGSSLFSVEAWIPQSKITRMFSLLDGLSVHCEQIKVEEDDKVPTFMENQGVQRLGEDLVRIYDVPAVTDRDPSGWVFWFFALFFAIIVADGGYGLLYLATAIYLKYKFPTFKGQAKRLFRLFVILSLFVIGWGTLTSSFFGLHINPNSFLGRLSPMQALITAKADYHVSQKDDVYMYWVHEIPAVAQAKNGQEFLSLAVVKKPGGEVKYPAYSTFSDNILLEISLMLGVIHISLSLLRYLNRNWAGIGWVAFLIGGYLYFPSILNATSMVNFLGWVDKNVAHDIGDQLLYSGIGVAVVLALIQKRLKGLAEIMNVVQVFADVLSYLRLYALALAGSIMAATFNEIGAMIGLVGGFAIIILGHGVNILLGLMAGVIHGLRLNFIEWYHYSFDGGGRLLKPLMLLKSKEE
jgi:V/A-type H+/Na+-transporting ATPase subunit I